MHQIFRTLLLLLVLSMLGGCQAKKEAPAEAEKNSSEKKEENQAKDPAPEASPKKIPGPDAASKTAPDSYKVRLKTTKGDIVIQVERSWAPLGADRFYNLVEIGYYNDVSFFRVVNGFVAQFGIHGTPAVNDDWSQATFPDDPVKEPNMKGTLTFATAGANTRTTQIFINFDDNVNLDEMGFSPFGKIVEGMDIAEQLHAGYGDGPPYGTGPDQGAMATKGNRYLKEKFPKLDYIISATIE